MNFGIIGQGVGLLAVTNSILVLAVFLAPSGRCWRRPSPTSVSPSGSAAPRTGIRTRRSGGLPVAVCRAPGRRHLHLPSRCVRAGRWRGLHARPGGRTATGGSRGHHDHGPPRPAEQACLPGLDIFNGTCGTSRSAGHRSRRPGSGRARRCGQRSRTGGRRACEGGMGRAGSAVLRCAGYRRSGSGGIRTSGSRSTARTPPPARFQEQSSRIVDQFFGHDRRPDLLNEVLGGEASVDDHVAVGADRRRASAFAVPAVEVEFEGEHGGVRVRDDRGFDADHAGDTETGEAADHAVGHLRAGAEHADAPDLVVQSA